MNEEMMADIAVPCVHWWDETQPCVNRGCQSYGGNDTW